MGIRSLFKKYVLPESIDFVKALQEQSNVTNIIINDLYACFIELDEEACQMILNDEHQATELKNRNMHDMLNAFITPIDRESIYRAVNNLNWVVLSVKHFVVETKAYEVNDLNEQNKMFKLLVEASRVLNAGFDALDKGDQDEVAKMADLVRIYYDDIVNAYVQEMARLAKEDDLKKLFIYKEILSQLREIGKRIYMTANTLQDIVVKMD